MCYEYSEEGYEDAGELTASQIMEKKDIKIAEGVTVDMVQYMVRVL